MLRMHHRYILCAYIVAYNIGDTEGIEEETNPSYKSSFNVLDKEFAVAEAALDILSMALGFPDSQAVSDNQNENGWWGDIPQVPQEAPEGGSGSEAQPPTLSAPRSMSGGKLLVNWSINPNPNPNPNPNWRWEALSQLEYKW